MKAALLLSLVAAGSAAWLVAASDDPPQSGPSQGEITPAFEVHAVSGPQEGQTLCYVCAYGGAPQAIVFARSLDDDSTRLVEAIDAFVAEHEAQKARAFVVFVAEQQDLEKQVREFAKEHEIAVPLTFPADGPEGDGLKPYKLNQEVPLTVLLADKRKVVRAFPLEKVSDETIRVLEHAFAGMLDSGA